MNVNVLRQRREKLAYAEREDAARRFLAGATFKKPDGVTFFSPKGGVGKTTIAAAQAITWASVRRCDDPIIVGADTNAATLSAKMGQKCGYTLQELAQRAPRITSAYELAEACGWQGEGVMVVASQADAQEGSGTADALVAAMDLIKQYRHIHWYDCGIDYWHPQTQAVFDRTDILVLIAEGTMDGFLTVEPFIERLQRDPNRAHLVENGILVLNRVGPESRENLGAIVERYQQQFRAIMPIGFDPVLAAGGPLVPESWDYLTRVQFLELSATIADVLVSTRPRIPGDGFVIPETKASMDWMQPGVEPGLVSSWFNGGIVPPISQNTSPWEIPVEQDLTTYDYNPQLGFQPSPQEDARANQPVVRPLPTTPEGGTTWQGTRTDPVSLRGRGS